MKLIPLTQGKYAIVDDSDYEWLSHWKWHTFKGHKTHYAVRQTGLRPQKSILMHRLISNPPNGLEPDHINHNGLDNRRANLRLCTRTQNLQNARARQGGTSRYKGVSWDKWGKLKKQWRADIQINKKRIHLGYFENEIEAAQKYDQKAKELFGEFAYTNF